MAQNLLLAKVPVSNTSQCINLDLLLIEEPDADFRVQDELICFDVRVRVRRLKIREWKSFAIRA